MTTTFLENTTFQETSPVLFWYCCSVLILKNEQIKPHLKEKRKNKRTCNGSFDVIFLSFTHPSRLQRAPLNLDVNPSHVTWKVGFELETTCEGLPLPASHYTFFEIHNRGDHLFWDPDYELLMNDCTTSDTVPLLEHEPLITLTEIKSHLLLFFRSW